MYRAAHVLQNCQHASRNLTKGNADLSHTSVTCHVAICCAAWVFACLQKRRFLRFTKCVLVLQVLEHIGAEASSTVMFEDSLRNLRQVNLHGTWRHACVHASKNLQVRRSHLHRNASLPPAKQARWVHAGKEPGHDNRAHPEQDNAWGDRIYTWEVCLDQHLTFMPCLEPFQLLSMILTTQKFRVTCSDQVTSHQQTL